MKTKIVSILIGMAIMGVLVGCGQAISNANAGTNGYLKYCGLQENLFGNQYKQIEVYEDTEHGKIVYVAQYSGEAISITAVDNNKK